MRTCGVCSARKVKIGKLKVKILCGIWIHPKHPLYEKKKNLKAIVPNFDPIQSIFERSLLTSRVCTNELAKVIKCWCGFRL